MHRSLGGIAPAAPGYATVTIAPQVSRTTGPSAVNASVATVRGVVKSSWIRPSNTTETNPFVMLVSVPVGSRAVIRVPLLGVAPAKAQLVEVIEGVELFGLKATTVGECVWLLAEPRLVGSGDSVAIELHTGAGEFNFSLSGYRD